MTDGFDAALDAAAYFEATHYDGDAAGFGDDSDVNDSLYLRIDRLDDIEIPAAADDPQLLRRLLHERADVADRIASNSGLDDIGDDETVVARNARIRERDAATRQADRPGGTKSDPAPIERPERPDLRGASRPHDFASAVRVIRDGVEDFAELGHDVAAIRRFLRGRSVDLGYAVDELMARPPRGRPTAETKARREGLAAIVAEARQRGAKLEALAAATNRPVSVVHSLITDATKSERNDAP